jgi:integral membrane sensor domain MASE1
VDQNADTTVRQVGGGIAGGSLLVASIWAGAGLSSDYRMTDRQALGIGIMGAGVASLYTSIVAVSVALLGGNGAKADPTVISRDTWIASAVGGLAVGPGLITAGYFVMGREPEKRLGRAGGPTFALAPMAGAGRTGVSLVGAF